MEYNQVYQYYYLKYYNVFEKKIKHIFIDNKANFIGYGTVRNELHKCLDTKIPDKTVINKIEELKDIPKIFNDSYSKYDEDLDNEIIIQEIFKNQIKLEFENRIVPLTIISYNFNELIREIALVNVSKEINRLLQNNSRLFEMFYKTKMFDEFEIRDYSGIGLEKSDIYIKLNKILYPEYYLNSYENTHKEDEKNETETQELNNTTKTTKETSNKLSPDEKSFLFYIMCKAISEGKNIKDNKKDEFNLPYTELLRLISLLDFYDEKVFTKNYRDSNHYQILSKGLNHFKKEDNLHFLQNLIKNIADYKLTQTTKYIKHIEYKIASQAVLTKK